MKKPSGRDAHLAEQKLAVNSTARARKGRKRLFVLRKPVSQKLKYQTGIRLRGNGRTWMEDGFGVAGLNCFRK